MVKIIIMNSNYSTDPMVLLYIFLWSPILTFFHELGHAFWVLIFTEDDVVIEIGDRKRDGKKFKFNRVTVYIRNIYGGGFTYWNVIPESKFKEVLTYLGGPLASLLTIIVGLIINYNIEIFWIQEVFSGAIWCAIAQFIATILPIEYNYGDYKGSKSDGLRILEVLSDKNSKVA
jgi:hypothetical protein